MPPAQGKHAYFDDDETASSTPPSSRPPLYLYTSNMPSHTNPFDADAMGFFTPDANAHWSWSARPSAEQEGAATVPRSLPLVPSVPLSAASLVPPPVPTGPPLPVPSIQPSRPPWESRPARTAREARALDIARFPREPREPRAPRTPRSARAPRPPRIPRTPRTPRNERLPPSLRWTPYEPLRLRFPPRSPSETSSCTLSDSDYSRSDDNFDEYGRSYAHHRRQQEAADLAATRNRSRRFNTPSFPPAPFPTPHTTSDDAGNGRSFSNPFQFDPSIQRAATKTMEPWLRRFNERETLSGLSSRTGRLGGTLAPPRTRQERENLHITPSPPKLFNSSARPPPSSPETEDIPFQTASENASTTHDYSQTFAQFAVASPEERARRVDRLRQWERHREGEREREERTYLPEFHTGRSGRTGELEDPSPPPSSQPSSRNPLDNPSAPENGPTFLRPCGRSRSAAPSPDSDVGRGAQPPRQ